MAKIHDFETYKADKEMTSYEKYKEHEEIYKIVSEREKNDNGKRYSLEDVEALMGKILKDREK